MRRLMSWAEHRRSATHAWTATHPVTIGFATVIVAMSFAFAEIHDQSVSLHRGDRNAISLASERDCDQTLQRWRGIHAIDQALERLAKPATITAAEATRFGLDASELRSANAALAERNIAFRDVHIDRLIALNGPMPQCP